MTSYAAFAAACPVASLDAASHTPDVHWVERLLHITAAAWLAGTQTTARNA